MLYKEVNVTWHQQQQPRILTTSDLPISLEWFLQLKLRSWGPIYNFLLVGVGVVRLRGMRRRQAGKENIIDVHIVRVNHVDMGQLCEQKA